MSLSVTHYIKAVVILVLWLVLAYDLLEDRRTIDVITTKFFPLCFENHQPQRTQISTVNNAPFIQNSNRMASRLTTTTSFPGVFVQLLQYSRQLRSFSAHRAPLMTKTDLTCPVFSLRFVHFAVQFCFRCKFHEKWRSSKVWQWRDFPGPITVLLLRIATNENASFCIDNRLRQIAFFRVRQSGRPAFGLYWKILK